jgi:hypothetical protein
MLLIRSENPRRGQAENPLKLLSEFARPALSSLELRELVHCVVQRIKVGGEQIDSSQAGGRCFDPLGRCKCTPSRKAVFGW